MKVFRTVSHPYLLIVSFLMVIISGQHFGGVYLLYLLLGLPYGALHSLLAVAGIGVLLIGYIKYGKDKTSTGKVMNLAGLLLLILSLFFFFYKDREGYNSGTFYQFIPLLSLIIFSIISFISICYNTFVPRKNSIDEKLLL